MLHKLFHLLRDWWKIDSMDLPDDNLRWIVSLSYGSKTDELCESTRQSTEEAAMLAADHPETKVAFGVSGYLSPETEYELRCQILNSEGIRWNRFEYLGEIDTTLQEFEALAKRLEEKDGSILIVCDELHARRVSRTWELISEREISLYTFEGVWEKDHPVIAARSSMRWLLGNILAYAALKLLGKRMQRLRHPTN